jgi:hypothetical protein
MRTATQVLLTLPATMLTPIGWLFIFSGYHAAVDALLNSTRQPMQ